MSNVFDLTGKNIGGPPPRPLTPFEVHAVTSPGGGPDTLVVVKA